MIPRLPLLHHYNFTDAFLPTLVKRCLWYNSYNRGQSGNWEKLSGQCSISIIHFFAARTVTTVTILLSLKPESVLQKSGLLENK